MGIQKNKNADVSNEVLDSQAKKPDTSLSKYLLRPDAINISPSASFSKTFFMGDFPIQKIGITLIHVNADIYILNSPPFTL